MKKRKKFEFSLDGVFATGSFGLYVIILKRKGPGKSRYVYFGKTGDNHPKYNPRPAIVRIGRHFSREKSATDRQIAFWFEKHRWSPADFNITVRYYSVEGYPRLRRKKEKLEAVNLIEATLQAEFGNLDKQPNNNYRKRYENIGRHNLNGVYRTVRSYLTADLAVK